MSAVAGDTTTTQNRSPRQTCEKMYAIELSADDILPPRQSGRTGEKFHILMPYGPESCPNKADTTKYMELIYGELKRIITEAKDFPKKEAEEVCHYFKYCCYYSAHHFYLKEGTEAAVKMDILLAFALQSIFYYVYDDLLDGGSVDKGFQNQKHKYESIVKMNATIRDVISGKYDKISDIPKDFTFPLKKFLLWLMLEMCRYAKKHVANCEENWPDFVRTTSWALSSYALTALEILDDSEPNPCQIKPSYEARRSRRFYTTGGEGAIVLFAILNGQKVDHSNLELGSLIRAGVLQAGGFNDMFTIKNDVKDLYSDNWILARQETLHSVNLESDNLLPCLREVVGYLNRETMEIHRLSRLILKWFPGNEAFVSAVKCFIGGSLFWHIDGLRYEKCSFKIYELSGYPDRDGQVKASDVVKEVKINKGHEGSE